MRDSREEEKRDGDDDPLCSFSFPHVKLGGDSPLKYYGIGSNIDVEISFCSFLLPPSHPQKAVLTRCSAK